jgi:glycosyltransferase involved in cell wall biosynthesis
MNGTNESEAPELVSVIIPAFNASDFIEECLRSAMRQTYAAIEIIVVDDGSTDNTSELVQALARQDARIRLFYQENQGVGAARNLAIRQARGVYVAPLDADDLWYPDKIERQVKAIQHGGPTMGAVYCWDAKINAGGELLRFGNEEHLVGRISRALTLHNFTGNASVPLFRAQAMSEVGAYLTRTEQYGGQGCEDWDLMIRIAERYQIGLAPGHLVSYRQLPSSMSVNAPAMERSFGVLLNRVYDRNPLFPGCFARWSSGNFYRYLYFRCLYRGNHAHCLRYLGKATLVDPSIWVSVRTYQVLFEALARLLFGSGFRRRNGTEGKGLSAPGFPQLAPRGQRWFTRIQEKRWAFAARESSSRSASEFPAADLQSISRQQ